MTIEQTNKLHEKAKTRKDGVYTFETYYWLVKDNKFIAFMNYFGGVYQRFGAFNTQIGDLSSVPRYDRKKELKKYLNKL